MAASHPDIRADADIRLLFLGKPASASGYPPALAGIQAGILGYPPFKGPARDRLEAAGRVEWNCLIFTVGIDSLPSAVAN
ncbi:Protein memo1 [Puccinia graminis f. sp. tritici]|uniref:Protein memo1 n=1 Tax=Puccinia graminis f. sp. tritici TaxID=56615 RepID=A0A5B0M326_PUCGR|nr:Protein memo1 [Puccinia graminis f. sp. tritici]